MNGGCTLRHQNDRIWNSGETSCCKLRFFRFYFVFLCKASVFEFCSSTTSTLLCTAATMRLHNEVTNAQCDNQTKQESDKRKYYSVNWGRGKLCEGGGGGGVVHVVVGVLIHSYCMLLLIFTSFILYSCAFSFDNTWTTNVMSKV